MSQNKISLLDCTLRDGGYINDWYFGETAIKDITKKIIQAGIDAVEVGFIRPEDYNKNRSVYSSTEDIKNVIGKKDPDTLYVAMLDMSTPVSMDKIYPRDDEGIDVLRVIFKKDKIEEGLVCCQEVQRKGYQVFVQPVGTDLYSDEEFIAMIHKFNAINPDALYIVDSFGVIKLKHFLRLVYIADHNLSEGVSLGYHSHNNLQQAFGNAQALVELSLKRNIIIDACVFGMGRGAGNLNIELFAEFLNENYGTNYRIEPMLSIADLYLNEIYKNHFWGYSLPFYLSASNGCHPNYAIYFEKKGTLTAKSFNEILRLIPDGRKAVYSKDYAEEIYQEYQKNYVDDTDTLNYLENKFAGKKLLVLAPGSSLSTHVSDIRTFIEQYSPIVISLSYYDETFGSDYVFCTNARRYNKLTLSDDVKTIISSNIRENLFDSMVVNYASCVCDKISIAENSGIMFFNVLSAIGVKEVFVAGMDGYSRADNFFIDKLIISYSNEELEERNVLISNELRLLSKHMQFHFLTPTLYSV